MDRDIPSFNRPVMDRIYAKNHQLHLKRLNNIKKGISSNKSYQKPKNPYLPHSNSIIDTNYHLKLPQYNNLKKQVNQQSKNAEIERQNALLFKKMIKIMKRPDKNNHPSSNRQRVSMNVTKQRLSMQFTRINEENRAFYHRLEHQKPTIDNKKLEEQRIKNLNILRFLGKYPNQQARARASQYKTFDLRSKRMNSTSNRVYYNNDRTDEYELGIYQDVDGLIEYRNQISQFERRPQQILRIQKGENKVNSTMGNFYNNRKKQSKMRENGKVYNRVNKGQIEQMEMYEPVIPSRRKFLSQGESRNAIYNDNKKLKKQFEREYCEDQDRVDNYMEDHQNLSGGNEHYQQEELYPYFLNHPSNNIVIEDKQRQSMGRNFRKSMQKREIPEETDVTGTNFREGKVNNQRKLNTKNVQNHTQSNKSILQASRNNIERYLNKQIAGNTAKSHNYKEIGVGNNIKKVEAQNESRKQGQFKEVSRGKQVILGNRRRVDEHQPVPNFSQNQQKPNDNNEYVSSRVFKEQQRIVGYERQSQRRNNIKMNPILLYRNIVKLDTMFLREEKLILLEEIVDDLLAQRDIQQQLANFKEEHQQSQLISYILKQISGEITIERMFDCYRVSLEIENQNNKNTFMKNNKRNTHKNQNNQQKQLNENRWLEIIDKEMLEVMKSKVLVRLQHVCQVEIPQREGSALLQEENYNYEQFIKKMLKIQKDSKPNQSQINHQDQLEQQEQQLQANGGYRLVIVLSKNEQELVANNEINSKETNSINQVDNKTPINQIAEIQGTVLFEVKQQILGKQSQQQQRLRSESEGQEKEQEYSGQLEIGKQPSRNLQIQQPQLYIEALDQELL